jgi:flavin reductase (DIM6/NTAB) family NADH-FMN oxidoreductase RutF
MIRQDLLKRFDSGDISGMEQRFRTHFINSITGFKSLNLVGTVNDKGHTNLALFSQVVHLGANPSLIGLFVRPDSVPRNTLTNIQQTKCFTLNHVSEPYVQQAHQTSARYPQAVSEFEATGLTAVFGTLMTALYVAESHIRIGLIWRETIPIPLNGTSLVIGELVEVFIPENCLNADGFVDLHAAGTITVAGLDAYYSTNKLMRLTYAKPDIDVSEIL